MKSSTGNIELGIAWRNGEKSEKKVKEGQKNCPPNLSSARYVAGS